jgi:glycosyltransferase involved in cell wall biosynthesis
MFWRCEVVTELRFPVADPLEARERCRMSSSCKKRVLIVGAFPGPGSTIVGGIVTTCKTLLESEFPRNFDLILIDSTQTSNPPPGLVLRLFKALQRVFKYCSSLLLKRPDAVLLFTAIGASVAEKGLMAWIARLMNIPALMFPRGAELIDVVRSKRWHRFWVVPAMRGAAYFLCQGPAWHRFAVSDLGFRPSKAEIIHNWSASADLLRIGANRSKSSASSVIRVLFLGWLEKEKGIFELLDACEQLAPRFEFMLSVAGRGHAEAEAKRFVQECNLNSRVDFVGWVHDAEKMRLLEESDILVLPSWAEGFPNAVIEAMSAKVSVIVTSVGNVPDLLRNREHALIIPPKNVDALRDTLKELFVNREFRDQLAEKGHVFARDTFSTDGGVARLTSILNAAISANR